MNEKLRQRMIKEHKCTYCQIQLDPLETRQMCPVCRSKVQGRKTAKYIEVLEQGICVVCRTNKHDDGYSTCKECREYHRKVYGKKERKRKPKFNWGELINAQAKGNANI